MQTLRLADEAIDRCILAPLLVPDEFANRECSGRNGPRAAPAFASVALPARNRLGTRNGLGGGRSGLGRIAVALGGALAAHAAWLLQETPMELRLPAPAAETPALTLTLAAAPSPAEQSAEPVKVPMPEAMPPVPPVKSRQEAVEPAAPATSQGLAQPLRESKPRSDEPAMPRHKPEVAVRPDRPAPAAESKPAAQPERSPAPPAPAAPPVPAAKPTLVLDPEFRTPPPPAYPRRAPAPGPAGDGAAAGVG